MSGPYDSVELLLSDWRRKGGPGRLDRVAARSPTRFAAVFAAMFSLGTGVAMAIPAAQLGSWWGWAVTAGLQAVVGPIMFATLRRNARLIARAAREWQDRASSGPDPGS
jgi:hypothetical protein